MFIFEDIAMLLAAAVIAGLLFWRLRQPLILAMFLPASSLVRSRLVPGSTMSTPSRSWPKPG